MGKIMQETSQNTVDGCEILHHQTDGGNPISNWINHRSTGARFRNHPRNAGFGLYKKVLVIC